ncbi:tetratricopeptide repeat protein [Xanthomarina sp. F1114]|uniref:tetratricopeptide repeat protein n=1 Tax=Xanthomarina sp. F1114 TaxID=2996019 RepID=UPI00225E0CFB|nr:tetratricopeptide repeat protein [Xanthomarina sp. F1114]MCX7549150.1 tetratricopeptide repeat protein [Xanthomarina sp. F1114]
MRNSIKILILLLIATIFSCEQKNKSAKDLADNNRIELNIDKEKQEKIINEHLKNGAWKYELYSREWQEEIDKGLEKDSTIAYLWQQKAMPMFKQGKYEVGMEFIDNAVKYDRQRWQDYRAFIKCIFAKTYREAIADFKDCKKRFGNGYVMDHTYDFYIGLSYLQLNEFEKAEQIFQKDYEIQLNDKGEDWLHHLDLFYFGISKYEQKDYLGAIEIFDKALKIYPDFSEVQIFKADCLRKIGKTEEARELQKLGEINGRKGNTINEDNVIYERYPYQIRWY